MSTKTAPLIDQPTTAGRAGWWVLVPAVVAAVAVALLLSVRLGGQVCALSWPAPASCFIGRFDWVLSVGAGCAVAAASTVIAVGLLAPRIRGAAMLVGSAAIVAATLALVVVRFALFGLDFFAVSAAEVRWKPLAYADRPHRA